MVRTQVPNKIRFGERETFEEEDQFINYCSVNSNSEKKKKTDDKQNMNNDIGMENGDEDRS